ncbi:MAG TPA: glycosyltransferase family 39 protein [Ktedonobacterales bacterium]
MGVAIQRREEGDTAARQDAGDPERSRRLSLVLAACGVVALAVLLHVTRLGTTPGWDAQEGYNLDIAWNLLHGQLRLFSLSSAFAQHPPLFYLQLALSIRVFGYGIVAVRALAALYAVLTCVALLGLGRRLLGAGPALWAAAIYAGAPIMLANTRWGYTYAQLAFLGVLCLWAAWRYHETRAWRWLLIAALLAGLATFSDYEGVGWALFVALVAMPSGWRRSMVALATALSVPVVGVLACYIASPAVFSADFGTTFLRATGGGVILGLIELLINYFRFVTLDAWVVLGLAGLFFAPARVRGFLFVALATVGVVALKVRDLGLSIHTAVPLLPLVALGAGLALHLAIRKLYGWSLAWLTDALSKRLVLGALTWLRAGVRKRPHTVTEADGSHPGAGARPPLRSGAGFANRWFAPRICDARAVVSRRRGDYSRNAVAFGLSSPSPRGSGSQGVRSSPRLARFLAALVVFLLLVSPLGIAIASDLAGSIPTRQDSILAAPTDAQSAMRYVLARARPRDLVLASPALAWRFDHPDDAPALQGADILQSAAFEGDAVAFYPKNLPPTRWAYEVSLAHARYVIVDDLVRQLAVPGQADALIPILKHVQQWPVVYTAGQYTVYERPGSAS